MIVSSSKVMYDIDNVYIPKDTIQKENKDPDYTKSLKVILTIVVRDKNGKVVSRFKKKSHSPTSNFIGLMLPLSWYNATGNTWSIVDTSNTSNGWQPTLSWFGYGIAYPNSSYNLPTYPLGIAVGSGTSSNPYSMYNLAAPISNGSGTGQLLYGSFSVPTSFTINGNEAYFIISQMFTNNSGATITISEVGILVYLQGHDAANDSLTTYGNVLVWYDTLSSAISLTNGSSATIYYTFAVNP
jgi:hypothetical protein